MWVGCGLDIGSKELKLHYYKISQIKTTVHVFIRDFAKNKSE